MKAFRFPLIRYYVVTSFIAITVISLLLGWAMAHRVRADLLRTTKEDAVQVIRHLQEDIRVDFLEPLIASGQSIDIENDDAQYQKLDAMVARVANAFGIRDLYIFDSEGLIVYSTRREHIGMITPQSNRLFRMALAGEVASEVRNRGTPLDVSEARVHPALLETYVPVGSLATDLEPGRVVANVVETYQDIEEFQRAVVSSQQRVVVSSIIGGLLLFAILFWIVRYADRLIVGRTDELLQSNEQLTVLSKNLEQEIARRTSQLLQKEKLASIGTLAAGLAHEVNNPIATVSTCAQGLRTRLREADSGRDLDLDDLREYVDLIIDESFRVKEITRSLLDFSRQAPGSGLEPVDLTALLSETVALFQVTPGIDDIDIELPDDAGTVCGDATTLRQLCFNLMTNAVDAIRQRHLANDGTRGSMRWDVERGEEQLVLSLTDNGIGFDPHVAAELVEPFYTTKEPGHGTGLGLALCHSMAVRLGGTLELASEGIGHGAVVRVTLPCDGGKS